MDFTEPHRTEAIKELPSRLIVQWGASLIIGVGISAIIIFFYHIFITILSA